MLVVPEAGADDRSRSGRKAGAAEIVILVFGLGGPVRGEHVFQTGADRIAVLAVAVGSKGRRGAADGDADIAGVAPGVTALAVQQRRTPGIAEPAGDRAELVVAGGHENAAGKSHAGVVAAEPAILGLGAQHPIRRELVIETALNAAEKPAVTSG